MAVPDIEIRNLSVCFETAQGPVCAVNGLSTTFRAGRISGVIGESGSGKSVMGMSLLRLLPNTAKVTGECFFGAQELLTLPLRELRKLRGASIGLIPQNPNASLDPVMKIKKQITEAITTHGRLGKRAAEAEAAELLRQFGFDQPQSVLGQYSFQMSGGMNQRLVSALGLACRPGWVIADEPTKGLDAVLRNQVYTVLRQIYTQHHSSMIVITHDLHLARQLCDDIRVLYMGQIIEQDTAGEVMGDGELRKLRGASIGLIPQNPNASLDPVMKIKKQITEAITTHGRLGKRAAEAEAAELLRQFGFDQPQSVLGQYSFQMSGGMNQRLVSALGLACRPGWVIADEPTKGLDAVLRNQVYTVLRQIYTQHHSSMIVITHDLHLARQLCDDIRVLYMGQIIEQDTAGEVMERPRHPYTAGLIHSLPSRGMTPIPAPDPARLNHRGCPFYPRCSRAMERCGREAPGDFELPDGGKVRCFLYA